MNFIQFKSEKPETIFAPWWFYIIGEDRLINIDFKKIALLILNKEKEIKADDLFLGISSVSLTSGSFLSSASLLFRLENILPGYLTRIASQ
jgi:hypothetical protein